MADISQNTQHTTPQSELEQNLLTCIPDLAQAVRASTTPAEARAAISDITELPTPAQTSLMKALSKLMTSDSADVLTALNTYAADKEIRKDARRALVRLESARVRSQWTPPIEQASAITLNVNNAPRYWRGFVTQSREEGELQLLLWWEQGYDYSEVRTIGFLLDFWNEGVKDCFIEVGSKRAMERRIDEMRGRVADLSPTSCTLDEGKRLLEEALSVNSWKKTEPAQEFRANRNLINSFILQASNNGEDSGRTFINPEMEDQETLVNFIGAWSMGDYGLAYDLLTNDSSVRNGLSRDEWIERHRAWFDEAKPARVELGFVHELERPQSALWVPNPRLNVSTRKDIALGWSLEMTDTPLSGTLREVQMGTAVNKETGRHWFWTSFTVIHQREGWRIQSITDEGAAVQGLPIDEIQRRIKEHEDTINAMNQQRNPDVNALMQELSWRLTELLHLSDALIVKLPLDRKVNLDAYNRSVLVGSSEHSLVYLERLVQRFPENRADLQRNLGATIVNLAYNVAQQGREQLRDELLARAEAVLRESASVKNDATAYMLLGELFLSEERNDEAEQELLKARELTPTSEEQASIEAGLGNIAMRRERIDEALSHFQHVADLNPSYTGIWFNIGFAHRLLGQFGEAEQSYLRAVEQEPNDIRAYAELTARYMSQSDTQKARAILEKGISANPDSANLHALYASFLFETGDTRGADRELRKAESIDPNMTIVQEVRQSMNTPRKR